MFSFPFKNITGLLLFPLLIWSCEMANSKNNQSVPDESFSIYWYDGTAEITSYALEQMRYGEQHEGTASLVFVTEDFSESKQVKLDQSRGADILPILKMNLTKKFITGIYPYSMMLSSFTPVERNSHPQTVKTVASIQEWCGQTYSQLNLHGDHYNIKGFSYFESEGDVEHKLKAVFIEDEIWNLIRIDPSSLPIGSFEIIPGLFNHRLNHLPLKIEKAEADLTEKAGSSIYDINFENGRSLKVFFDSEFPHEIEGWEERMPDKAGRPANFFTTKATKLERTKLDYWNHHGTKDLPLRQQLKLK